MALRRYKCVECEHVDVYFDHEADKLCEECGGVEFTRQLSVPLQSKNTECLDKYHNVNAEKGITEDLRARSTKHTNDTIDELIEEHGEKIAKEQGWLRSDDGGKTWRKRNDFDTGTLHKTNSGSAPVRKNER